MSLMIAGERSGVGKTTVTLALLAWLSRRQQVQSFKVGPDYIDPMFHQRVTGRSCRNLDPFLTSEAYVQQCFAQHSQNAEFALVEGVMGLFDGAADTYGKVSEPEDPLDNLLTNPGDFASTAHVARLLDLPVLLVVDCSRLSFSVAAIVRGYRSFDPRIRLAGVVLNRVGSDRHLELLKAALEPDNVPILGVLRRQESITIPDRHLGLVPTAELPDFEGLVDRLIHLAETSFDWSRLLPLLRVEVPSPLPPDDRLESPPSPQYAGVRIAIAHDPAFSFYYADNLDVLRELGAELLFWSPLQDSGLPEGTQGLYFGGGFPEMFAAQLAENGAARTAVRSAIQAGMPTYAECGGLMYLCRSLTTFEGEDFPMVGVLPTSAVMGSRLTLGYRRAIAQQQTPLVESGQVIWGHEFHRSRMTTEPEHPIFAIAPAMEEGWHLSHLHASYLHVHWGAQRSLPERFLSRARRGGFGDNLS